MGGGVPGHSLQAHCRIDQLFDPLVPLVKLLEAGGFPKGILQRHMGTGRDQLCHHVRFGKGEIQCTAHVTDGAPGGHGTEGNDLGHPVRAVLSVDIVNDLAPALLAEIRIEIGHTHPLGVQEALKV